MKIAPNRDFQSKDETIGYAMPAGDENHHTETSPTELIEEILHPVQRSRCKISIPAQFQDYEYYQMQTAKVTHKCKFRFKKIFNQKKTRYD